MLEMTNALAFHLLLCSFLLLLEILSKMSFIYLVMQNYIQSTTIFKAEYKDMYKFSTISLLILIKENSKNNTCIPGFLKFLFHS